MRYVNAIAVKGRAAREQAIVSALKDIGVGYEIQSTGGFRNIVVSFNVTGKRLVIGAHYDSYPGSTGANDNASSCSILLRLISTLKNTDKNLEFVFFDAEERGGLGSRAYIGSVGRQRIAAMLNLDVCGNGSVICMEDKSKGFYGVTDPRLLQAHRVCLTDYMPFGDDKIFHSAGIPTVALCMANEADAAMFRRIGSHGGATRADEAEIMRSHILSTMHNGRNDSLASVEQTALDAVTAFLTDALR